MRFGDKFEPINCFVLVFKQFDSAPSTTEFAPDPDGRVDIDRYLRALLLRPLEPDILVRAVMIQVTM